LKKKHRSKDDEDDVKQTASLDSGKNDAAEMGDKEEAAGPQLEHINRDSQSPGK
jgi:hypothetical protein